MVARCLITSFLWCISETANSNPGDRRRGNTQIRTHTHTRIPTCFPPPPGLSFSFVRSLTTVVPRLYRAFASPRSSSSRSPCTPDGGGDSDIRGESGAGGCIGLAAPLAITRELNGFRGALEGKCRNAGQEKGRVQDPGRDEPPENKGGIMT